MGDQRIHQPTSNEIAQAAYLLWEREGRRHGLDVTYWLRAERQLMAGNDGARLAEDATAKPGAKLPKRPVATRRSGPKQSDTLRL